jgi:hypothetical protein
MADPYRIAEETPSSRPDDSGSGLLRPVLWLLLIVSAAANGLSSAIGLHALVGIGFGLITLACIAVLVVHHYRNRNAASGRAPTRRVGRPR